jgi:aminoglycoside/choline kinase family phosphotransferase
MIDPEDDTDRFAIVAKHLTSVGLSAPMILARAAGLMLLEDFGDAQFASVIATDPALEISLYEAATDVLLHLETTPVLPGLTQATPDLLGQMINPAFAHYLTALGAESNADETDIAQRLIALIAAHVPLEQVLILRDFHAENMIWLPERAGVKRVGLLDFQDALAGPPIYDLVSMLQDARRDVTDACRDSVLARYVAGSGRSMDQVLRAYHLLGLQRNLRILGIFARLAILRGKPHYLDLLPRVWAHIETSLDAPVVASLAPLVRDAFPAPTPDRLIRIKDQCRTP